MSKKILILKNDRTGDLFVSLKAINSILNKHSNKDISIFLSNVNHKFNFLFPKLNIKIFSMNLNIIEKIKIFFYFLFNRIDSVYILTPKSFYFFLPFVFRKIKFYAITIKAQRNRPSNFFLSYLHKYVIIDRVNIRKRNSSYNIQYNLIDNDKKKEVNLINIKSNISHNFKLPNNYVFFHYKHNLFGNLLKWKLDDVIHFLKFLSTKYENVLFSSELNNKYINDFFMQKFNTLDFDKNIINSKNDNNIFFLKDIDGYNLFDTVKNSKRIIAPEGIITHIGYFLNKSPLALMHFNLKSRKDFISQIISCKEWFPPDNYKFIVLKKDVNQSIKKLTKRIN